MEIASPQQDRDRSGRSAAQTILTPHPSQTATRQGTQRSIPTQSGRSEFVLDEEFWHSPPEPTAGHLVASSDDAPGRDADSSRGGAAINQMAPPRPDLPTPTGEPLALGPTILACVNSPSSTLLDPGNIASMAVGEAGAQQRSSDSSFDETGASETPCRCMPETTNQALDFEVSCSEDNILCSWCCRRIHGVPTVLSNGARVHWGCGQRQADERAKELDARAERRHVQRQRRRDHAARWHRGRPKRQSSHVSQRTLAMSQCAPFEAVDLNDGDISEVVRGKPLVAPRRVRPRIPLKRSKRSAAGICGAGVVTSIACVLLLNLAWVFWQADGWTRAWRTATSWASLKGTVSDSAGDKFGASTSWESLKGPGSDSIAGKFDASTSWASLKGDGGDSIAGKFGAWTSWPSRTGTGSNSIADEFDASASGASLTGPGRDHITSKFGASISGAALKGPASDPVAVSRASCGCGASVASSKRPAIDDYEE